MIGSSSKRSVKSLQGYYAGFVTRFIAFCIDMVIISVLSFLGVWFFNSLRSIFQLQSFINSLQSRFSGVANIINFLNSPEFLALLSTLLIFAYFVFFWFIAGQTLGMAVMGIRIVPLSGGRVSFPRAFLRYIGYFISALAVGLGFLWIIIDDRRMGWHDKLAGTCVVYTWDARPDETFLKQPFQELIARRKAVNAYLAKRKGRNQTGEKEFDQASSNSNSSNLP